MESSTIGKRHTVNTVSHFDDLDAWRHNQDRPWNRLRYLQVAANLRRLIGEGAGWRVLDIGGGDGRDALPMAQAGHDVTVLDSSPIMLAEARRRAEEVGVGAAIHTQFVDVADGELSTAPASFDLVICHNLLQYLPNPAHLLRAAADALCMGGWFSLLIPNPASEALRLALRQHDLSTARASLNAATHRNQFYGVDVRLYRLAELQEMLSAAGLKPVDYLGVRCVNDYIDDDDYKFSASGFEQLVALEEAMSVRSPYRDIARFWQILAHKEG